MRSTLLLALLPLALAAPSQINRRCDQHPQTCGNNGGGSGMPIHGASAFAAAMAAVKANFAAANSGAAGVGAGAGAGAGADAGAGAGVGAGTVAAQAKAAADAAANAQANAANTQGDTSTNANATAMTGASASASGNAGTDYHGAGPGTAAGMAIASAQAAASVADSFKALSNVWSTGDMGFCTYESAKIADKQQVQVGASTIQKAITGTEAGYAKVNAGINLGAAAGLLGCDQGQVQYVKHGASAGNAGSSGSASASSSASASADGNTETHTDAQGDASASADAGANGQWKHETSSGQGGEKWYKHPQAPMCQQCTPCGKDD